MNNNVVANDSLASYQRHIRRVNVFVFLTFTAIVLGVIASIVTIVFAQKAAEYYSSHDAANSLSNAISKVTGKISGLTDKVPGVAGHIDNIVNKVTHTTDFPKALMGVTAAFWVFTGITAIANFIYAGLILSSLSRLRYSQNPAVANVYKDYYSTCLILFLVTLFVPFVNGITAIALIVYYIKSKNQLKRALR